MKNEVAQVNESRGRYRRYADRRMALMLALYEILFEEEPGEHRDQQLLHAITKNYEIDQAALFSYSSPNNCALRIRTTAGHWTLVEQDGELGGVGIETLVELQTASAGALSLTRTKRPSAFSRESWDDLWDNSLKGRAMSLLSISITPQNATPVLMWMIQTSYSREWNSRDRELAEEAARLMAKVADRELKGVRF